MKHGHIEFNTTTNTTNEAGSMSYNAKSNSLTYNPITPDNDVTVNIGFENLIRVYNDTGFPIINGQVIHLHDTILVGDEHISKCVLASSASGSTTFIIGGVATHAIPTNSLGFIAAFGDVHDINLSAFAIDDDLYLSDTTPGGLCLFTSLSPPARTCYVGTVLSNSATTGILKLQIQSEIISTKITQLETNILLGNVISTGVYEFTGFVNTSPTFTIPKIAGWIVENTGVNAYEPVVTNVNYAGATNVPVTNILTSDFSYILLTKTATIIQQVTFPTPIERRDNIFLGKLIHPDRSTISLINHTVDYDPSPMSALRDMFASISMINDGITPSANGVNLNFNTSYGTLTGMGIGWHTDNKKPNTNTISAKNTAPFSYLTQTGGLLNVITAIDPSRYDLNGVATIISAVGDNGAKRATNQRIYMFPDGSIAVQYGQTIYDDITKAVTAQQTEQFIKAPYIIGSAILIGLLAVRRTATNLSDTTFAIFTPASMFGESIGSINGISTTTLQQAYNNSIEPEIITDATLGAVTIKRGSTLDTDKVLEIQNGVGNITASIDGNGNISGNLIQLQAQNNISLESTGFRYPELTTITGNGNRTITIGGGISVQAYWRGISVSTLISGYTSPIHGTDTTKIYYLYYDGATIAWYTDVWTFDKLQICLAKYDPTNATWYYFRECHGLMQWQTHEEFHRTVGTFKQSGGTIPSTSYVLSSTVATERRIDIDVTVISDEDLPTTNSALTTKSYTQFRLTGADVPVYTLSSADIVSLSTNQPYYNSFSTPNWGQTLIPANAVASVWIYAQPVASDATSQAYRYLFVQPQWITQASSSSAGNITTAIQTESTRTPSELNLDGLSSTEIIAIARIIIVYTANNWSIRQVSLLSGNKFSQIGSPAGNYLTVVSTDLTLTGSGTTASPLKVNRTISRDWTTSSLIYDDEIVVDIATNYLYRATTEFTSDTSTIQTDITAGRLVQVGGGSSSGSTGVETMQLGDGNATNAVFDGSYAWIGIVIPLATVTVSTMKIWCTQGANGTLTLGIYDSSYTKMTETTTITNPSTGLISGTLNSSYTLTKGTVYYFAIGGSINGLSVLGSTGLFSSNTPYISKEDLNATSLPTNFSGGSSTGRRFWIGAYT